VPFDTLDGIAVERQLFVVAIGHLRRLLRRAEAGNE
jgi:hypothetical protein